MRNIDRIPIFLDRLGDLWKQYFPDWRFGQLMLNFMSWASQVHGDPFFWEEDDFIKYLDEFISNGNKSIYNGN